MDDEPARNTRRGTADTFSRDRDADRDCNHRRNVHTNAVRRVADTYARDPNAHADADADSHADLNSNRIAYTERGDGDRHGDAIKYRKAFGVLQ